MFDLNRPPPRTRETVVRIAKQELGENDAKRYWEDVLPPTWKGPFPRHWCGAFALWCLRQAGLTDWHWEVGKGFLYRLPIVRVPEPGDIGYQDKPFQHHFVVTDVGQHTFSSVDGNQGTPGVQERHRSFQSALHPYTFFSIQKLLGQTGNNGSETA